MNNFQNYSNKRFVSPPKIVGSYSESYGSDQKKEKQVLRNRESRPSGALKIFYESENFNEPQFEWKYINPKKTNSKDVSFDVEAEEKNKLGKSWKKSKEKRSLTETDIKKPNYLAIIESQLAKTKAKTSRGRHKPENRVSNHLVESSGLISEKSIATESEKGQVKSLLALSKTKLDLGKRPEKIEAAVKTKESSGTFGHDLIQKNSEKAANKSLDLKTTISDYGKRHINEILKNHAQKIHTSTVKTFHIKDYSVQSGSDVAKNLLNNTESSGTGAKEAKESQPKPENKSEEKKTKPNKPIKDKKCKINNEVNSEERKKLPGTWLTMPQSNELERRLVSTWKEPKALFFNDRDLNFEEGSEEDKKNKKPENHLQEDEKKTEKKTYTDRLLAKKNLEEKKQLTVGEINEQQLEINQIKKSSSKEKQEILIKKVEAPKPREIKSPPVVLSKEVYATENKETIFPREEKFFYTEHILKTKQTRSMELRDLVSQAIKDHKIFCIFDNHSYIVRPVREELLSRGWLEVIPDRRLIPRRRPPPMGPTYERDKAAAERNCNTLEAILTAKENFADEILESVSRSSSFKLTVEKPKPVIISCDFKRHSDDSLTEVLSLFRISPPSQEKKKSNCEIREFTAKYQALLEKESEREKEINKFREKEKMAKLQKKERSKTANERSTPQSKSSDVEDRTPPLLSSGKSIQAIIDSINNNKEVIKYAAEEIKSLEGKKGESLTIGVLFDSAAKTTPTIKNKEAQENKEKNPKAGVKGSKTIFSDSDAKTISKIIQSSNARINFMWLSIKPGIHLKCFNYSPEIINKFQKTTFCTKIGLWSHLSNIQWYAHEVSYPAKSPRMYNTGESDDLEAFFRDFQLTACIGLLKWLSDTFLEKGLKAVQTKKGKVPLKAFEFAIKQCEKYIRFKDNEDLTIHDENKVNDDDWDTFLQWFYIITNDHGKIQESSSAQLMVVYTKAVETLKIMRRYWPEMDTDGRLNIWIMKPYCASCGRGIFMTNNMYYIGQHSKYIVQKYIEKPLLIYNTKFDIRQWFMITKLTPLEIWMYRECYLRFCTQPFALRNLHESVHLSNNSVQRKYTSFRDPNLPDQNMWDSNTFQFYLKTIGYPTIWEEVIYPGMRDAIVSTMLAAQDTFDGPRKSWFEVYGADFMLSANLREGPWLIEINENPAMDPSTKVTARLCPQMLRDVIKVVVDKRSNKNASTGQWELIYRQNFSPSFGIVDLDVRGKKIARVQHATKVSLNLQQTLVSPSNSKKIDENQTERNYDIVKVFGGSKNKGEDFSKPKSKRKSFATTTPKESEFLTRSSDTKLKKTKKLSHTAHSASSDNKPRHQKTKQKN